MNDPEYIGFSVRLKDRFGDHGLISIVIGRQAGDTLQIDTWLMSCRVLKRQVEEEVLNELARLAKVARLQAPAKGSICPPPRMKWCVIFMARMGFTLTTESETKREFELRLDNFQPIPTKIKIVRRAYEPS